MKAFRIISILLSIICIEHLNGQNQSMKPIVTNNRYDMVCNPASAIVAGTSRDFLTASPTAGSLGVFRRIPVGNHTGTAEISVPLYEIKYKELSVSIGLNYHASGIKPELFLQ